MLDMVTAVRFDRRMGSGRTRPVLLGCEMNDDRIIEVVTKLSAGCDRGVVALVAEAIAAMLAADLDLPVPEPLLVQLDPAFVNTWTDDEAKRRARKSVSIGFGSRLLPHGFATWPKDKEVPTELRPQAIEILAFDAFTFNDDRRPDNPNCLCNGVSFAIFDHELSFMSEGIIGRRRPWEIGGLEHFRGKQAHLFADSLRGKGVKLDRLVGAWSVISDGRLDEYRKALPLEWSSADQAAAGMLGLIAAVRDNISVAVSEFMKVMA